MHIPRHFDQPDQTALKALIRAHPFATLVASTPSGPSADHLPLLIDAQAPDTLHLHGHIARANPLWQALDDGAAVLAVFHGPQAYVSPNWYPSKAAHGRAVPTWNYMVVHAHARLQLHHDAGWIRGVLDTLSRHFEAGEQHPWRMHDAPGEYIDRLVDHVVGVELVVTRLEGQWKLSQNKPQADRRGVIAELDAHGASDVADAMRATD